MCRKTKRQWKTAQAYRFDPTEAIEALKQRSKVATITAKLQFLRSYNIMGVGPPNFEGYKTEKQTRIPVNLEIWRADPHNVVGNIGRWPLKLKTTKDAALHATQTRQKSGPDQTY